MDSSLPSDTRRTMLWTFPRSLSTVMQKCLSFVPHMQVINEPYNSAMTFGPEGFRKTGHVNGITEFGDFFTNLQKEIDGNPEKYKAGWDDDVCTYDWVKDTLEADYPGKRFVFCKDFIYAIGNKYDKIPDGFTHTFMIRNPIKVFHSNRKHTIASLPPEAAAKFDISDVPSWKIYPKYGYGELIDLIAFLKDRGMVHQSNIIIIDADDLQNHTVSILRQCCEAIGLPYSDSLLTWEAGDACVSRNWYISKGYLAAAPVVGFYDAVFASTGVQPVTALPDHIPDDVLKLAARAEPYYQELYKMRIKP